MEASGSEGVGLRLCDLLRDAREEILAEWERALLAAPGAPPVAGPQLRDHIPGLLDRIADVLDSLGSGEPVSLGDLPDLHAIERLEAGFDLGTAARELALLRTIVLERWRARLGAMVPASALDDVRRFDAALDEVTARSVDRYAAARERTLAALDRLSAAALGSGDVDRFLPRLLETVLETTAAADLVLLMLREGDLLRVRAAAGLAADAAAGFVVGALEGFPGRIVREGRPLLVSPAASEPPWPAAIAERIRAMYGVPLLHGGEIVGVACMGSATADALSGGDRLLFRTMAQRATSMFVQAQLVERERAAIREGHRALDALEHGDPFLLVDRDWRIVLMNERWERASRTSRADAIGRVLWDVYPDARDPAAKYWREYHRCMDERVPVHFEERYAALDMWTEVTAYPAADGGVAVFLRDVSERKRAEARARQVEEALHGRERELARFFAISPDMLGLVGADGYLKRVNAAYAATLGYAEEELLTRPYLDLVHPEDREAVREEAARVLRGEPAVRSTFRMVRRDGEVRWVTFSASADPGAAVFASVGRDVTDERRREELEQQLIGIVSHDLRNPLSAVLTATGTLMRRAPDLDERTLRSVGLIQSAAQRAIALIRDLLDFTKARTAGGLAIAPAQLDLHAAARAAAAEVHQTWPDRTLRYEQTGAGEGQWDPARIEQVVANLVSNAMKYGAPHAPVVLGTHGEDGWVRIEVHNEGPPIDPALLPHIFEPLRQGRRTGGVGGVAGVGLGLFIVEHVVRAHGGTIEVRSTAEEGTTFVVRLPRHPPARS